jgi:hypothetical protein
MNWEPAIILQAKEKSIEKFPGYICDNVGMYKTENSWFMVHISSGHVIFKFFNDQTRAFYLAEKLMKDTDWTFDGVDGWRNRDPELLNKLQTFYSRHFLDIDTQIQQERNPEMAKEVLERLNHLR